MSFLFRLGEALYAAARDSFLPRLFEVTATLRDAATPQAMRLGCRTLGNRFSDNPVLPWSDGSGGGADAGGRTVIVVQGGTLAVENQSIEHGLWPISR